MNNRTKWLVALPFGFLIAFALPAAVARDWLWFSGDWAATLYVVLTAGMWLGATAFVDVDRPRGPRDATDNLIALALLLSVPVAVADRRYGWAGGLSPAIRNIGVGLALAAVLLGVSARLTLGRAYRPGASAAPGAQLVRTGPYRLVRHPLYSAMLLWLTGWPLLIGSVAAPAVALLLTLPALARRMDREEADLRRALGQEYYTYCAVTWRLVPFIY